MKKPKLVLLAALILSITNGFSQEQFTLSGKITDAGTGEDLIGATVVNTDKSIGTATNTHRFYSFTLL